MGNHHKVMMVKRKGGGRVELDSVVQDGKRRFLGSSQRLVFYARGERNFKNTAIFLTLCP